jgi:hypothetical protein
MKSLAEKKKIAEFVRNVARGKAKAAKESMEAAVKAKIERRTTEAAEAASK